MIAQQLPSGLFIPRGTFEPEKQLCCGIPGCGKRFPMEQRQQWERHVKACAKRNEDVLMEPLVRREESYLTSPADPELFRHIREGGN